LSRFFTFYNVFFILAGTFFHLCAKPDVRHNEMFPDMWITEWRGRLALSTDGATEPRPIFGEYFLKMEI